MADERRRRAVRISAARRHGERVSPLELFFDLVFVLAITQCTALMASEPTWEGLGKGLLVLGVLWWAWVGYAWLTSVVDPEEGLVRIVMFAAMAADRALRRSVITGLAVSTAIGVGRTSWPVTRVRSSISRWCAMITYEAVRFAESRAKVRHELWAEPPS